MLNMSTSKPVRNESSAECPGQPLLQDYWLGLTDEYVSSNIDRHLEACATCNYRLSEWESGSLPTSLDPSMSEAMSEAMSEDVAKELAEESRLLQQVVEETKRSANPLLTSDPPSKIGPYQLIQLIGRGGMGRVYRATHQHLQREVAIKLLPMIAADPLAIERFNREVQAVGRIQHPALVKATDAGIAGDHQFLVMEYIDGWDLGKIIPHLPKIRIADACELIRQIALGLASAHSLGMVHRDIKPSNIMLDRNGNAKLLDFGLVLMDRWDGPATELTSVGQFLGTLDYMAPEQAERSTLADHRSDLYSLGATLFRLLTQQHPLAMLPTQSPMEKLRILTKHHPVRIQTLRNDVPNELAGLIDQMLSTRPETRPASAAHVAEALMPWSQGADLRELATLVANQSLPTVEPLADAPQVKLAQSSNGRKSIRGILIGLACLLPFAFYLGITLILESRRGNLIVESTVDDLKIRVEPIAGDPPREWRLHQGASLTKLEAGEYRISLEGNMDGISIDRDVIQLSRGQTIVARITRQSHKDSQEENPISLLASPESAAGLLGDPKPSASGGMDDEMDRMVRSLQLPQSVLESKNKGESCREILVTLATERDRRSWIDSLSKLSILLDEEQSKKLGPLLEKLCDRNGFTIFPDESIAPFFRSEYLNTRLVEYIQQGSLDDVRSIVFRFQTIMISNGGDLEIANRLSPVLKVLEQRLSLLEPSEIVMMLRPASGPFDLGVSTGTRRFYFSSHDVELAEKLAPRRFAQYPWCGFFIHNDSVSKYPSQPWLAYLLLQCSEKKEYAKFHYLLSTYGQATPLPDSLRAIVHQALIQQLDDWIASKAILPNDRLGVCFANTEVAVGLAIGLKTNQPGSQALVSRAIEQLSRGGPPMSFGGGGGRPDSIAERLGAIGGLPNTQVRRPRTSNSPLGGPERKPTREDNSAKMDRPKLEMSHNQETGYDLGSRTDLVPEAFLVLLDCSTLDRTDDSYKTLIQPRLVKLASVLEQVWGNPPDPTADKLDPKPLYDFQWNQQGLWRIKKNANELNALEYQAIPQAEYGKILIPAMSRWIQQIASGDLLPPSDVINDFLNERKNIVTKFGEPKDWSKAEQWFVEPLADDTWKRDPSISGIFRKDSMSIIQDRALLRGKIELTYGMGGLGGIMGGGGPGSAENYPVTFYLELKEGGWRIRSWKFESP